VASTLCEIEYNGAQSTGSTTRRFAGWNRLPWPDAPEGEDTTCRCAVNAASRPGRRVEQKL